MFVERAGGVDVAKINTVEGELSAFISKRDKERRRDEGERAREELWAESCRVYAEQRQQSLAWEWLRYHVARQRAHRHTFALLDAQHEAEIRRYSQLLGLDGSEPHGHEGGT